MKWYEEPMTISAEQCNYHEDSNEIFRDFTVAGNFNTEQLLHLCAEGHYADYIESRDGKKLDEYLKQSRKAGIREIVYYNVHVVTPAMKKLHDDWAIIDKDGNEVILNGSNVLSCINESYTENFVKEIKSLCSHDIDGLFLDGPVVRGTCYCKYCQKDFREMFHKDIKDATPKDIMKFNIMKGTRFIKKAHDTVKSVNPDIILYVNNSTLRADITGNNTRTVLPYVDFLGTEGGFVWVNKSTSNYPVTAKAKLIFTQAEGKPCVSFQAGDLKPWSYCMHTAEETILYYAQAIANGSNVWYGIHGPIPQAKTAGGEAAIKMNKFVLDHKEIYTKHTPVSNVAIVWSQNSANYYKSSVGASDFTLKGTNGEVSKLQADQFKEFMGMFEILAKNHVQYDVIDEVNVEKEQIAKYGVVIMPVAACLSSKAEKALETYVNNGGCLITTFVTGFLDEEGNPLDTPRLKALRGIKEIKEITDYKEAGSGYQKAKGDNPYMKDLSWELTPSTILAVNVEPEETAKVCAEFTIPMVGRYVALPDKFIPSIIENKYGKGKSIYLTGNFGEFFSKYSNPDYSKILMNMINDNVKPIVKTNAPASVEMELRKTQHGYALHTINFTAEMDRPISRIIDLYDIEIELSLPEATTVYSVTGDQPKNIQKTENGIKFTVPKMTEYEVFIIE